MCSLLLANGGVPASDATIEMKFRFFHGAHSPLIDYGNYRVCYYLNDTITTWGMGADITEGAAGAVLTQQNVPPGPTWNQRLILSFNPLTATTTEHMQRYGPGPRQHWGTATCAFPHEVSDL